MPQPHYFIKHEPSVLYYSLIILSLCVSKEAHVLFQDAFVSILLMKDCGLQYYAIRSKVNSESNSVLLQWIDKLILLHHVLNS